MHVAKSEHDKALQRALLQYFNPKNQKLVEEALKRAKRYDLIGYDSKCLVKPTHSSNQFNKNNRYQNKSSHKNNYSGKNRGKKR